jgi:hypothetical protein
VLTFADKIVAVVAMLVAIRPLMKGVMSSSSHLSWPRLLAMLAGGVASFTWTVGLLALRSYLFREETFLLPNGLGSALAVFGGLLGVATLLAQRGEEGMTEQSAIRSATQAAAMALYVAAPLLAAAALGTTRLLRATMPWTLVKTRWRGTLEGVLLLALCAAHLVAGGAPLGSLGLGGLRTSGLQHLPL